MNYLRIVLFIQWLVETGEFIKLFNLFEFMNFQLLSFFTPVLLRRFEILFLTKLDRRQTEERNLSLILSIDLHLPTFHSVTLNFLMFKWKTWWTCLLEIFKIPKWSLPDVNYPHRFFQWWILKSVVLFFQENTHV